MPPKQRGARRAATKTTNAQQPPQRQPEQQFPKKVKKFAEALAKEGIETVGINKIKSFLRMGSGVINVKFDSHIWDHSNRAPKRYTLHQITLIDLAFIFERNDILLLVMQECYSPDCSHCYEDPITGKRISYFAQTVSHLSPIDLSLLKQMLQLKDIDTQTMVPKFEGHTPRSLPLLSFLLVFPEIFDYESIELLVKAGADVNQPDEKGNPPLIYVMTNGWGVKMVSLFITYGLDVWNELIPGVSPISGSDKLDQKWSYLMCAQASGRLDALDELLEYMNKNDPTRTKALLNLKYDPQNLCYSIWAHSILKNNLGALKILLRYGKPIWCEQEKEQVQELLNSKAPEIASEFRRLLFGSEHFVQNDPTAFLFEYFRYLLQTNESNIEEKQIEKLLRLIEKIDDENKFQDCLYDIMQLKIPFDQKNRLLNQLAHHYKSFNSIYKNCSTPLTLAIVNNLEPEARWLLDNGADPNLFAPPYSASPLTLTILVDNNSSMMLLLNHPRILIDNMGPFIAAAMCGKMGTLQTLVLHAKNILRLSVFNQTAPIPFPFKEFISYSQKVYGSSTCTLYGAAIYSGSFKTFSYVVENMTDKSPLSAELYLMLIVDLNRARMLSHLIELEKKAESKPIQAAGTSLIVYAEQSGADKIAQLIKEYLLQFKTATAETPTTNTADPPVMSPSAFFSQIGMSKGMIEQFRMGAKQTKQERKHGLQGSNFFKVYQVTPPQAKSAELCSWFREHIDNMHQSIKLVENAGGPTTYVYLNYAALGLPEELRELFNQVRPRLAKKGGNGICLLDSDLGNVCMQVGNEKRGYKLVYELKIRNIGKRLFGVAIPADQAHNRSALIVFCFYGKALHATADAERLRERVKTTKQTPIEVIKLINDDEYDVAGPPQAVLG